MFSYCVTRVRWGAKAIVQQSSISGRLQWWEKDCVLPEVNRLFLLEVFWTYSCCTCTWCTLHMQTLQRDFAFRSGKPPAKYTHEYWSNYWALRTRREDIIICQQDTSDCCHGKFTLASLLNSLFTSFLMTCSKQWFELLYEVQRGGLQLCWMNFHRLMVLRQNQQQLSSHMQANHLWIGLGGSCFCDA